MKKLIASLAMATLAGVANAQTVTNLFPDGDFDHPAGANGAWFETGGGTTWNYPTTGGNPGGYGVMNGAGGWGIWVGGNTTPLPIAPLGLVAGNTYDFTMDMNEISAGDGAHPPGVKIESWGPNGILGNSGDMTTGISAGWQTYTFSYSIAPGATGIKVVPLWSSGGVVGYDNIGVIVPPQPLITSILTPDGSVSVPTNFTISATAVVSPGAVTNISFYDGVSLLGKSTNYPFSFNVVGAAVGVHPLKVVAKDNHGNSATSDVVNVTVEGIAPPAPNYPTNTPPTPLLAPSKVISLYNSSGVYTDRTPCNWYPWGGGGSRGDFVVGTGKVVKSYLALQYAGVEPNGGVYDVAHAMDISAMNTMHIDVWTTADQLAIKMVSAAYNGAAPEVVFDEASGVITTNHWISLNIPLASFTNINNELNLAAIDQLLWVDNGDIAGPGIQNGDFYFDNVYFYSNGVVIPPIVTHPTNNAPTPTNSAAKVLSMFNSSGTYTDHAGIGWYANWSGVASMGDYTIPAPGTTTIKSYLGLSYSGVEFYNPNWINAAAYNMLHMDVWTTANQLAIKLVSTVNGAAPEVVYPASSGVITSNHWVSLDIPMSSFTSLAPTLDLTKLDQMLFVDNGDIPGSGVQLGSFYVDNVYFYSNSVAPPPPITHPTNNAPLPTQPAGNVLSMFNSSGTYTDHAGIGWYANWSGVSSMADYAIPAPGTTTVKSYLGLSYAGVEFYSPNWIDASPYNTLHVDVWTTANQLGIKLVSTVNGAAPELIYPASSGVVTSNHWVSLDIPLTAFTALAPGLDLTKLDQLLWIDNGDIAGSGVQLGKFYIDNVYLYTASVAIIRPVITNTLSGGNIHLSFPTQNGKSYTVQYKTNLTDSVWQTLTNFTGSGSPQTINDQVNVKSRFYRVSIQ